MAKNFDKEALEYHREGKPGKVTVSSHKECSSEHALSLAYSPGVAAPCKEIAKKSSLAYEYTAKGNLVAVISNGTAVLGLGNIGPLASKPVMEGKGVLFKQFAGIDVFDLELNTKSTDDFIAAVQALEPTFGGINLEDIKAPDCFVIEEELKKKMKIPVFHDDRHGTAIITAAALVNSCMIQKKNIKKIKIVFNGAGAAAMACARLVIKMGVSPKNLIMCDSKGVIYTGRTEGMNPYKEEFAANTKARSLKDAMDKADVFVGLSVAGVVTASMLKSMAKKPIVFAMANPDPEIDPALAKKTRDDVIMATGRSDYPNQVNNVLGFPSIFRGALDVRATQINEEMKIAAVNALAELAREDVPEEVSAAYANQHFTFGVEYIIPKPFDLRVLKKVAPAVAKAAMDTGVAKKPIKDFQEYELYLDNIQGYRRGFIRKTIQKIKHTQKSARKKLIKEKPIIVFPEGHDHKVLRALQILKEEDIITPVLLGYPDVIESKIKELDLDNVSDVQIIHPSTHSSYKEAVETFYKMRQRKGVLRAESDRLMSRPTYFSAMMVHKGLADGLITGAAHNYDEALIPILQIVGTGKRKVASGLNIVLVQDKLYFFADTTVCKNPTPEQLCTIARHTATVASHFGLEPRIALLSYSNFKGADDQTFKMKLAAQMIKEKYPDLIVDGEMQADTAINPQIVSKIFPFCEIKDGANILLFPNLEAGNISYKILQQLGGGEVLGPFLMGLKKPANVLQRTCTVEDIVNTTIMTTLEIQAYQQVNG